ncbi:MAG: hypothetical protein A2X25_06560 [Chloroflexi bacterium GWB2_49_20]|nr:MAG: hypothetical protein A2X25_06560 [Chloroflexi bacterium GWB2_49_20]OGN80299.1 MAG: hypothetical protein A2X26_08220 [Chloroflexi bacterium GWC2_49_37]OGN86061.1 MAG: hypothetical protein A2X27_00525 [Chloroflexi bacterium GWD2_49_16]
MKQNRRMDLVWSILAGIGLGLVLARLDGQGNGWRGWLAFSLLSSLGWIILVAAWRWAGSQRWLGLLLLLAFSLRLGIGVSLSFILPESGYVTEVQKAGYNSVDAYNRDMQAWELASSDSPILDAFDKSYAIDQYGGLEALSALVYRYLSPDAHRPWLVILMAAVVAALGVAFFWNAVRFAWNERLAWLAAWMFALYPESLWLGSSQMREPFLMTFIGVVLWGAVAWQLDDDHKGWLWLAAGLAGLLFFSPGVAIYLIVILAGWIWLKKKHLKIPWRGVALAAGVFGLGLLLLWVALRRGTFAEASFLETLTGWFKLSVKWDVYQLERDSGTIQYLFRNVLSPKLKLPFIFVYGLLQPVLPAAIFDPSTWIWQTVGILRSLGWYLLLPLLVFSLITILKSSVEDQKFTWLWFFVITWLWISISSLRAGGDQWDNPRYRVIFLIFQVLLAAKAWLYYQESRNPWFTRIVLIELVFTLLFVDWYATRFFPFIPRFSFTVMVLLIVSLAAIIVLGGWLLDRRKLKPIK